LGRHHVRNAVARTTRKIHRVLGGVATGLHQHSGGIYGRHLQRREARIQRRLGAGSSISSVRYQSTLKPLDVAGLWSRNKRSNAGASQIPTCRAGQYENFSVGSSSQNRPYLFVPEILEKSGPRSTTRGPIPDDNTNRSSRPRATDRSGRPINAGIPRLR
jgi:hypothetical protein